MTDETDFAIPGTTTLRNKLGITDSTQLRNAEADFSGYRLVELQCAPIRGSFDTAHLQNIHHYLYQDLYDWAGELRRAGGQVQQSLDRVLDRLAADNHLRGLSALAWKDKAADYIYELDALQPFVRGNGIALREFAAELAAKNQLELGWDIDSSARMEGLLASGQAAQSATLRRLIMLAMDKDAPHIRPSRGNNIEAALERSLIGNNLI
jgi:cell filamentation protein